MDILLIIVLIIVAVLLFLAELFLIPGMSIAGILSGVAIIYANYLAFVELGSIGGWITLLVSAVLYILGLVWFMNSKTLDRLSLKKNIEGSISTGGKNQINLGDTGVTTTRLALIGYADFNGQVVEVKSTGEFIEEGTPIIVHRIVDNTLLVERKK